MTESQVGSLTLTYPWGYIRQEVRLLAIAIPAGLLIGLSLGALGGGGSILTVPVLVSAHPRL